MSDLVNDRQTSPTWVGAPVRRSPNPPNLSGQLDSANGETAHEVPQAGTRAVPAHDTRPSAVRVSLAWHGCSSSGWTCAGDGKERRRIPGQLNEVASEPRAGSCERRSWFGPGQDRMAGTKVQSGPLCTPAFHEFASPALHRQVVPVLFLRQRLRCAEARLKARRGNRRSTR